MWLELLLAWTLYFTLFLTFLKLTSLFPIQFFKKSYFFWPCTYRFTHQGSNPWPLEWKRSLNHWSTWEVLVFYFKNAVFQQYEVVFSLCTCVNFFLCLCRIHGPINASFVFSSVQCLSRVRLFVTPWTAARQASLSIANSGSLLKLMSIEWVMPSNYLILCHPLFLLPSIFPSIRVFSNESVLCIKWPKDWSSSFSISPSNEYSGIISFRMNWFDLLAVQGTPKSLPQHHSSKASVLQCSAFFVVWLSYPYMIIGKTMSYMKLFLPASIKTSLGSWTVFQHSKCSVNDGFQANEPRNIPDPCS